MISNTNIDILRLTDNSKLDNNEVGYPTEAKSPACELKPKVQSQID